MKKFGLLLLGGLAAIVLLHNLAPIVGMVISLAILYFVVKRFLKTDSILMKIGWGILGLMALMASASNIPAVLGIAAGLCVCMWFIKIGIKLKPLYRKKRIHL